MHTKTEIKMEISAYACISHPYDEKYDKKQSLVTDSFGQKINVFNDLLNIRYFVHLRAVPQSVQ